MKSVKGLILELAGIAESPLYSTAHWVSERLGHEVALRPFLALVDELLQDDQLRLWEVDPATHDRTEWYSVPEGLADRYEHLPDLDPSYDPLGLSLTPGSQAGAATDPGWEVDLDLRQDAFALDTTEDAEGRALAELTALFPSLAFVIGRREPGGRGVHLVGSVKPRV